MKLITNRSEKAESGKRKAEAEKRKAESGKRKAESGKRKLGCGRQDVQSAMGDRQSAMGDRQWAIGDRQWAIGNRQWAIGNRLAGFTMVEIAIAIGVIGFALVAIIGILPAGLEVQRDNRTETIINQDGTFWLEAIRHGTRGLDGLADFVDRIEISGPSRNAVVSTFSAGALGGAEVVGLLTTAAVMPDHEVHAYVWSVSGSAAEKEPNRAERELAFKYRMSVQIDQATNFALPFSTLSTNYPLGTLDTLYQVRLTLSYPLVPTDESKPTSRRQVYRAYVNRNIVTNVVGGTPYFFFAR